MNRGSFAAGLPPSVEWGEHQLTGADERKEELSMKTGGTRTTLAQD